MSTAAERTAREVFGWEGLRPGQSEAIEAAVAGFDTLVVFPTGAGKSAVYQIAGVLRGGVTVVVSPLIALQRDQVESLAAVEGAPRAFAVNSTAKAAEVRAAWEALESGEPLYLFLAPEQLAHEEVVDRLRAADVRLVVVDEAHCVSAWGHDFRPDYLRIAEAVAAIGGPPVLAMTATASSPVRDEIIERLGLREPVVEVRGVDRPEIHLAVRRFESDGDKRDAVVDEVAREAGPALVYVATRADTAAYAEALAGRGRRVAAYHGAMPAKRRGEVQDAWMAGDLDVVVATSAFGMGIDKRDVRLVAHADVTESLDAYAQELGRAARDGEHARAMLFYRPEDFALRAFFAGGHVAKKDVAAVLSALTATPRSTSAVAKAAGVKPRTAGHVLDLLASTGHAAAHPRGCAARGSSPLAAVVDDVRELEETRQRIRDSRIHVMRGYAETTSCRRVSLLEYFGVGLDVCGGCDRCDAGVTDVEVAGDRPDGRVHPDDVVTHRAWGRGTVMSVEDDRLTVFFDERGYVTLSIETLDDGILTVA